SSPVSCAKRARWSASSTRWRERRDAARTCCHAPGAAAAHAAREGRHRVSEEHRARDSPARAAAGGQTARRGAHGPGPRRGARGSLREALRYLELQGVLRIKSGPGGGPVIETPNGRHFASTLALMLQFVGARFRALIETRWVVEPGIAALAAERATPADLDALRKCLEA